ncbi:MULTISPECIES: peptidylprolyl isomerase [Cupriavidus]
MPILVNGVELEDADIERELAGHAGTREPARHAVVAAVLRHLVRAQARQLGLHGDDETLTQALLEREVGLPEPDEASCRRHYDSHRERFRDGEWVDAAHILFQVTPRVPLDALRETAAATLAQALADPRAFAGLARERSNCPSGGAGGSLGRLFRGETVPEFERALFAARQPGVLPRLVETRHGLHVAQVLARCDGTQLPFDAVRQPIARALAAAARDRAWKQYASLLIGGARIEGIDLGGAATPLVQ